MMDRPLADRTILVTRPAHQAEGLAQLIRAAGGNAMLFPVIEIVALDSEAPVLKVIDALENYDLAIFVSPNAVKMGLELVKARRQLPAQLTFVAVGPGTAKALRLEGVEHVAVPADRHDSEGLLELADLQDAAGKRIVIFRGEGGREVLGDTLLARGASVEYAECYRRRKPRTDAGELLRAFAQKKIDAISITSSEGLRTLCELTREQGAALRMTPLFVPHERIGETARGLEFAHVVQTESGDEGLVRGLTEWFTRGSVCLQPERH